MPGPAVERYEDFDLRIEKAADGRYRVRVSDLAFSDLGEAASEFVAPFTPGELETFLASVRVRGRDLQPVQLVPRQKLEELGGALFRAVFSGKVYEFWRASLHQVRKENIGLRVRLRLRDPDLVRWPWEYLFDPDEGFLALSSQTPIVRYLELPAKARSLGVGPPIRILVAIASPAGHVELDAEKEWQGLKKALAGLEQRKQVILDRLENASLSALQKFKEPFHVFHFIGHGTFETEDDEGVLLFEEEGGEAERVSGKRLASVLRKQSSLGLVVLNACHGARTSADAFGGVAQSLIWGNVPAVIAMRSIVSDRAAVVFAQSFYEALARRLPLEEALCESRQTLFAESGDPEWGIPVLYMRSPDGQLFGRHPIQRRIAVAGLTSLLLAALGLCGYLFSRGAVPPSPTNEANLVPLMQPPPRGSSEGCPPIEELGIVFKRIEPGKFTMGARGQGKDAKPHEVTLTQAFCMSQHEITQAQWEKVIGENPSEHRGSQLPVERVSWNDVQGFLRRLRPLAPKAGFRLPTEAQWEYAARGKSDHLFSFGDDPNRLPAFGNCESRSRDDRYDAIAPVGSFAPNDWGLYDMHGNVSEWTADWWAPYDSVPQSDPTGKPSGKLKARRGGSFQIKSENCDTARRNKSKPDARRGDVGFRIARDVVK
jgi:hypothetical protein